MAWVSACGAGPGGPRQHRPGGPKPGSSGLIRAGGGYPKKGGRSVMCVCVGGNLRWEATPNRRGLSGQTAAADSLETQRFGQNRKENRGRRRPDPVLSSPARPGPSLTDWVRVRRSRAGRRAPAENARFGAGLEPVRAEAEAGPALLHHRRREAAAVCVCVFLSPCLRAGATPLSCAAAALRRMTGGDGPEARRRRSEGD